MVSFKDVSDIRMQRARNNHENYKEMWRKCSDKVLAETRRNKYETWYVLSPFVPGKPLVNVQRASRYICDKLRHRGFQVEAFTQEPFVVLFIDWKCFSKKWKEQLLVKAKPEEQQQEEKSKSLSVQKHTDITDEILAILAK